jgi:hypothetical protein
VPWIKPVFATLSPFPSRKTPPEKPVVAVDVMVPSFLIVLYDAAITPDLPEIDAPALLNTVLFDPK